MAKTGERPSEMAGRVPLLCAEKVVLAPGEKAFDEVLRGLCREYDGKLPTLGLLLLECSAGDLRRGSSSVAPTRGGGSRRSSSSSDDRRRRLLRLVCEPSSPREV